jgi:pimeloyl-ACP methyl ester carboxylesterase
MADGYVETRGIRLTFSELGPTHPAHTSEPAPVLVLVHGLSSNRHIWDLVAPDLARRYHVVALDQRGHGESDQPETGYDFASIVADLAAFLDALNLHQPVLLVGHSWGASVVLHFAVEHPDRTAGLVLLDGGTSSPGERLTWDETLQRLTRSTVCAGTICAGGCSRATACTRTRAWRR